MRIPASNLPRSRRRCLAPTVLGVLAAAMMSVVAVTSAQYQVNNQIYGNPGPSVRYGWGPGYSTPPTVQSMPSENWHEYYQSNGTPAEVAMNMARYGPMTPKGFSTYLPNPGPGYTVGSVGTIGNYAPTGLPAQPISSMPGVAPIPGGGSVRYSAVSTGIPGRTVSASPVAVGAGAAPMGAAMPAGARISGSVRYGG